MKRQLFVDTETTGLDPSKGHRIIELGVVEMVNRKPTGKDLHLYFKPDVSVEKEALQVHGITDEFLKDKPTFLEKYEEVIKYFENSELVIHNAKFDLAFLNHELSLLESSPWRRVEDSCQIIDTLVMARKKHPGQKNSLDALCTRYNISNSHRKLHGALLDAKILAEVYLMMTGGQTELFPDLVRKDSAMAVTDQVAIQQSESEVLSPLKVNISSASRNKHEEYLSLIDKHSNNNTLWRKL